MKITANLCLKSSFRWGKGLTSIGQANHLQRGKQFRQFRLLMEWKAPAFLIIYLHAGFLMNTKRKKQWMAKMIRGFLSQLLIMTLQQLIHWLMADTGSIRSTEFIRESTQMMG